MISCEWLLGCQTAPGELPKEWFPASVPGCAQKDYARAHHWPDVFWADNAKMYDGLENLYWRYRTVPRLPEIGAGERLYFVAKGVDYEFDILIGGKTVFSQEGMFTPVELDVTELLHEGDALEVLIHPAPKRAGAAPHSREEADQSVKPAVSYGWDWHPYLVVLGIWDECGLELRPAARILSCEPHYTLDEARRTARVHFETAYTGAQPPVYTVSDPEGQVVYQGEETDFALNPVRLWWCNGQGQADLYRWSARLPSGDTREGRVGFRDIALQMNADDWNAVNGTRSNPPMTITLNGRRIFAKGTNWVNPELFPGTITRETYLPLIQLAKDAHFNLFRIWGGAIVNKEAFFDLCDEMGILVWQEFPLACNNYLGTPHYLKILEQEARSIVRRVRRHPSHALWCGGNELFTAWSRMTDQSLALRLLNKVCYEEDPFTPFLPTSPVMNVSHGYYRFLDDEGQDVMTVMQRKKRMTAYTEFGVPSMPEPEYLKTFIPEAELFPPRPGGAYEFHHAFNAWNGTENWLPRDILDFYFEKAESLEALVRQTQWLQAEGYKAIYEEARRQKPYCSMALNWCYNEPWPTAANNSLVSYPAIAKKALRAVAESCRDTCLSLRIPRFDWKPGDRMTLEPWVLNDAPAPFEGCECEVTLIADGKRTLLRKARFDSGAANVNVQGEAFEIRLPADCAASSFTLEIACAAHPEWTSAYTLLLRAKEGRVSGSDTK